MRVAGEMGVRGLLRRAAREEVVMGRRSVCVCVCVASNGVLYRCRLLFSVCFYFDSSVWQTRFPVRRFYLDTLLL